MITTVPAIHLLRKRFTRYTPKCLESVAERSWVIAPGEKSTSARAFFLPGQLERVTGWAFTSEHPVREMNGGIETFHEPTRAFLIKNALLVDGTVYKDGACSYLRPRTRRWPGLFVKEEIDRGAIYCTPGGNQYFGQWLMDDCVTYPLANTERVPVTTDQTASLHTNGYEQWLDMNPHRCQATLIREAIIFRDVGQNQNKRERFRALGKKLLSRVETRSHPGVFIMRGQTGMYRRLINEIEIAEYLRQRRGFRILYPEKADVSTIVKTCAGARVVAGVEGSALIHGVLLLPPGGDVLTLQPPNRFVGVFKHLTDRDGQHFGFVVGIPCDKDFRIDPEEVERTLDLFPSRPAA